MENFKKRYISMRDSGKYDLQFFFDYYLSKGGKLRDGNQFTEHFLYTHMRQPTMPGYPSIDVRTGEVNKEDVLNHLDGVFELLILKDKDGNFIKVIK